MAGDFTIPNCATCGAAVDAEFVRLRKRIQVLTCHAEALQAAGDGVASHPKRRPADVDRWCRAADRYREVRAPSPALTAREG